MSILTIGHSNLPLERFLALLGENGVALVADVRSAPYSRYAPQFNREALAAALTRAGIEYLYLGRELGGLGTQSRLPGRKRVMSRGRVVRPPGFRQGIERLAGLASECRVAIVCGEESPARCHRRSLVTPALVRLGIEVRHIRADGRVQGDDEVEREASGGQTSLEFDS